MNHTRNWPENRFSRCGISGWLSQNRLILWESKVFCTKISNHRPSRHSCDNSIARIGSLDAEHCSDESRINVCSQFRFCWELYFLNHFCLRLLFASFHRISLFASLFRVFFASLFGWTDIRVAKLFSISAVLPNLLGALLVATLEQDSKMVNLRR